MEVKQISTGIFVDKKEVIAVELRNDRGSYVKIFNYGTIINQFVVKNSKGEAQDIVLGFDKFEDYISAAYLKNYPYLGAIIGRYANRIKDGKFTLDGTDFQLALNNDGNCLHGGNSGFDSKVWDIVEIGANDGISCSNTWGLSERGWTGFMVEPIAESASACRKNHAAYK